MSDAIYAMAAVMILSTAVTWTVGRVIERIRDRLAVMNAIVVRISVGLICGISAAEAAVHGGYAWIVVALLGLLALWSFTVAAAVIFAWAREGLPEPESP